MGVLAPLKASTPPPAAPAKSSGPGVTGAGMYSMLYDRPLWTAQRDPQAFMRQAQELYRTHPWIGAAEDTISSLFSTVAWHLEDDKGDTVGDASPEGYRVIRDLLEKPLGDVRELVRELGFKPATPANGRELRKLVSRHMGLCGISFIYLDETEQTAGTPLRLFYVNPARVHAYTDKAGNLLDWVLDWQQREGTGTPLGLDNVLPFVLDPPDVGHLGIGKVERAVVKAQLVELADRHGGGVLASGGRLAGMVAPKEGFLNDEQYAELVRNFRAIADMPDAAKRTAILRGPIEFIQNTASPEALNLVELGNQGRDDLLALWNVPLSQLGGPTAAGLNSGDRPKYDEATLWQKGVGPRLDVYQETMQTQLLDRWAKLGLRPQLVLDRPTFDDDAPKYELASKAESLPLSFDERREIIGKDPLDPKEYGDLGKAIFLPALLVQVDVEQAPPPAPVLTPPPPPPVVALPVDQSPLADDVVVPPQKAHTVSLPGVRRVVEMRFTPAMRKSVAKVLEEQRVEIASKVRAQAAHIARRPSDTSVWWNQSKWDKRLLEVLRPHVAAIDETVSSDVAKRLAAQKPGKAATSPQRALADIAARVTGINQATRDAIAGIITRNIGLGGAALGDLVEAATAFDEQRSERVARTESARAQNSAQLATFNEFGVTEVDAIDGDGDEECAARNGQRFSVEDAMAIEDHPNGTLDWAPVLP